jgi:hypothetical protein
MSQIKLAAVAKGRRPEVAAFREYGPTPRRSVSSMAEVRRRDGIGYLK